MTKMNKKLMIFIFGIIFFMGFISFASAITDTDLISYYSFDGIGGIAQEDDVFNHLYNGTQTGTTNTTGKIKFALDYSGTTQYVSYPSYPQLKTPFSLSWWINPDTTGNFYPLSRSTNFENQLYLGDMNFIAGGGTANYAVATGTWTHLVEIYNGTHVLLYVNNVLRDTGAAGTPPGTSGYDLKLGVRASGLGGTNYYNGQLDELAIFNRTLNSTDISELYNGGAGLPLSSFVHISTDFNYEINLTSPENGTVINVNDYDFISNMSIFGLATDNEWDNGTINVWFNNGTVFNQTVITGLSTNETGFIRNIENFSIGTYYWDVYACYSNATWSNCSWSTDGNYTFSKGSSINSLTYENHTYETKQERFIANVSLLEGAEVSLAQLIYNGTTYVITNITTSGNYTLFDKTISIPLNVNPSANQTNQFYFKFTYDGNSIQTFGPYEQNSSFIKLIKCGSPYTTQSLNFTFFDEYNYRNVNATANETTFQSTFYYWIGDGSVYKNYSFQNLSSTLNNYQFCIYPYQPDNFTFKTDLDLEYYADGYRENKYYLRNSTLTNVSNDILLFLLTEDIATKFFLTFKQGTSLISNAVVTVQKFFVGTGEYQTVAILGTDEEGEATMWQEVDKKYKYFVVQDGTLLGTSERVSICSAAPCSLTILIEEAIDSGFSSYYDYYASNVVSSLVFDKDTKILTYTFLDVTGLANYLRLQVNEVVYDGTGTLICNSTSYSSSGTITCNMTGYEGEFIAKTYISRSPEKLDQILSFIIEEDVLEALGSFILVINLIIFITVLVASAVISKGNPSSILFMLGITILGLKLAHIFPFTWTVTVVMEALIVFMMIKIKT